jgi:DNA polymerase-3 subunit delta'
LEGSERAAFAGDGSGSVDRRCVVSETTETDEELEPRLPRETGVFYGHAEAERALLEAYKAGRLPHAWLLNGPTGIGKATLAYRMARFVFAHPDPGHSSVQSATSLYVDAAHPAARRIAAQAQGDLLVLERTINEKTNKLRQDIAVDDVRQTVTFFGSTPAQGGWRIAIVDSVDELNTEGANALLKIVEEPPARSLLLLVSHSAARVLPTIRSRSHILKLRPLSQSEVALAAASAVGRSPKDAAITAAAAVAEGSISRALALLDRNRLELRNHTIAALDGLPSVDPRILHAIGDRLYGVDPAPLAAFVDAVNGWLAERLKIASSGPRQLERVAAVWERFNQAARDVEEYNLERKPLVFNVFGWLAETSRD